MARKNGDFSKSDLIRNLGDENPGMGPTEMSKLIKKSHGLDVAPAMISTVLSKYRAMGKTRKPGRPAKTVAALPAATVAAAPASKPASADLGGLSFDSLVRMKQLVDEIGGVENAGKALDALTLLRG